MKKVGVDAENLSMSDNLLNLTYFEALGMPLEFELDAGTLEKNYHQKQRECHPDQFANCSREEKLRATEESAFLNEAFLTLKSPLLRGKYLLRLQKNEEESVTDPVFLMEVLEQREKIESLITTPDLQREAERLENNIKILEAELKNHFKNNSYKEAADILIKLQYQTQALQDIQDRLI